MTLSEMKEFCCFDLIRKKQLAPKRITEQFVDGNKTWYYFKLGIAESNIKIDFQYVIGFLYDGNGKPVVQFRGNNKTRADAFWNEIKAGHFLNETYTIPHQSEKYVPTLYWRDLPKWYRDEVLEAQKK